MEKTPLVPFREKIDREITIQGNASPGPFKMVPDKREMESQSFSGSRKKKHEKGSIIERGS